MRNALSHHASLLMAITLLLAPLLALACGACADGCSSELRVHVSTDSPRAQSASVAATIERPARSALPVACSITPSNPFGPLTAAISRPLRI